MGRRQGARQHLDHVDEGMSGEKCRHAQVDDTAAVDVTGAPEQAQPHHGKGHPDIPDKVNIQRAGIRDFRRNVAVPGFRRNEHPEAIGEGREARNPVEIFEHGHGF